MAIFAIVDVNGSIVNRIVLDEGAEWEPQDGSSIVAEAGTPIDIGGTYLDRVYTPPVRTSPIVDVAVTQP